MTGNPREIERKFLVVGDGWKKRATGQIHIEQGYLAKGRRATIRVRIRDGRDATLTIKSRERGISRDEFEYKVPLRHARALLALCGSARIEKQRYTVPVGKLLWEVDAFLGRADNLVMAEIELEREDQAVKLPAWVGAEVSADPRYRNSSLVGDT
jgi:adenylate cyclase